MIGRSLLGLFLGALALGFGAQAMAFELGSPDIAAGATVPAKHIFSGFGCSGANVSPALVWRDAPAGTKSFAVTVYDPDAPTGSGWWHWVIFNIPSAVTKLPADAGNARGKHAPRGSVQSMTDFGQTGYGGPCPPQGDRPHHYVFTVYALKVDKLPLTKKAPGAMVGFYLNANAIGKASFTATYGR